MYCYLIRPATTLTQPNVSTSAPKLSERDKTKIEMQAWLEMPSVASEVDILAWWREVGQVRFPRIAVMARQFLAIPASSATAERVFSFAGLTLSDLRKSLLDATLEAIMWAKWGPTFPLGEAIFISLTQSFVTELLASTSEVQVLITTKHSGK